MTSSWSDKAKWQFVPAAVCSAQLELTSPYLHSVAHSHKTKQERTDTVFQTR